MDAGGALGRAVGFGHSYHASPPSVGGGWVGAKFPARHLDIDVQNIHLEGARRDVFKTVTLTALEIPSVEFGSCTSFTSPLVYIHARTVLVINTRSPCVRFVFFVFFLQAKGPRLEKRRPSTARLALRGLWRH